MRLLLDTQVFLWMFLHPGKIKPKIWQQLRNAENHLYLSAASAWEIAIKVRIGKMRLPSNPALYVPRRARESNILSLPITEEHALAVAELPMQHTDPFDRMLTAQAQLESLTVVTTDPAFERYDVKCIVI
ncbi:MAG TPA: type II toxin-antitoxin system VapC family toxin [Candidatus Cybelea sp.]|nr:type II toxin-antitoxin system VapC family toxin [Candidatus Cybelea sp.]